MSGFQVVRRSFRASRLLNIPSKSLVATIGVRAASSDAHYDDHGHSTHDAYEYRPEGFFSPFWRNTAILTVLGLGLYQFMPTRKSLEGQENRWTSWIQSSLTTSNVWQERNNRHLELSVEAAEAKHVTSSARRPLVMRTRYLGKFEDASPHKRPVGDTVSSADLEIKYDQHMKPAQPEVA